MPYIKKHIRTFFSTVLSILTFFVCTHAQVNLNNGLIAYYPFSGNANDISGNNHHGMLMNGPQLTTDRLGTPNSSYHFDGIDDFIQILNSPGLNPANGLSVALLFNPEQNGVQTLIGKIGYNPGLGTQFQVAMDFGPQPGVLFGVNPFSSDCLGVPLNAAYANTGGSININQWYCVVGTFENGFLKIYLDGVLIETINTGFTNLNQCTNADIQIGSWWSGDLQRFKGKIDEVRIYNRALNQQEVNALCETQSCSNWLRLPSLPSSVTAGELDIPGDKITVEAMINRTTPYTGGNLYAGDIVSKHDGPVDVNYLLRPNSAEITTTNGYFITPEICAIELNKTYHVAMVYDGNTLKFYRNGFLMSQVAATGNLIQNNWPLRIGYYFNQSVNTNFIGYVNEVRIWNSVRSQTDIRNYMNSSLPSPTTQTGLLAYYTFDNLLNKQGNPAWNGTLNGSALINQVNPSCTFLPDSCCVAPEGSLGGSSICEGSNATLTFNASAGTGPFTLTYTDGTNIFIQPNVQSGVPFNLTPTPLATTTYTLQSIQGSGTCPPVVVSDVTATVIVNNCTLCTGSLGDPVVNITFGSGNNPGQPLQTIVPGASTTLTYVAVSGNPAAPVPIDGQYTITNNIPSNAANWHPGTDHTPGDTNGFMAFYNSQETAGLEFYKQTISNLCGSTTYEFAAWVANCLNPAAMDGVDPNITFRIEKTDGTLIASFNTGAIPETTTLMWQQHGFFFRMPANESTVVLKMINNSVGGNALPGNDIAIDDITFRPCGPLATSSFDQFNHVDSFSICEGSSKTIYGSLSNGYPTPNTYWQSSQDNGVSWSTPYEANASQTTLFTRITGTTRTMLFRMIAGDGNNINSPNCRISSNIVKLTIHALPQGQLSGDTVCIGSTGDLIFNSTSPFSPFSITVSDGTNSFNLDNIINGSSFQTPAPIYHNTIFSLVSIRNSMGCVSTSGFFLPGSATILIRQIVLNAPTAPGSACEKTPLQLNGNNNQLYTYQWSPSTYLNDPNSANPISTPDSSILYNIRISEPVCNYDSNFTLFIAVNPNPVVNAQKTNDIDCSNLTSQLQATGALSYTWSPSVGLDNPKKQNPVASISSNTTFTVTGRNEFGCIDTDTISVKVTTDGKPIFEVPNAFTPNGDGKNDCFGIRRWGNVSVKEFSIFNRWGQLVFSTKDPTRCWDGTINGQKQATGGYTYVILASSICGEIKKTGIVMLIR